MTDQDILSRCDHTLLKPQCTWDQIKELCDDGVRFGCASVCIPAAYVKRAADYLGGKLTVCTVIGFPNGYSTTAAKVFEAGDAVENGAGEIDMVVNVGWVKDGLWDQVLDELKAVKAACRGRVLKVIIETCLLTDAEKETMCEIVAEAGADYIKTSTGFSTAGATFHDIELFARCCHGRYKIKAAGGISTVEDMERFVALGADRLGTSRAVKLLAGQSGEGY